jgi:hypothetical protein
MWTAYETSDLFLITTNSTLKANGALVMGRGIARQARGRFPGLDQALGKEIGKTCGDQGVYHLLVSPRWPRARLGCFQVKRHWAHPAAPALIQGSCAALTRWAHAHPGRQICLNFPGIGNGRLPRTAVLPLLTSLPDTVTIWEYPDPPHEKQP